MGVKAGKIFTTGVAPAMTYGAAVHGLSNTEVTTIRRTAAQAFPPRARNRSLTTSLLLGGNPTAKIELAPVSQLARMIWKTKTAHAEAVQRKSDAKHIRSWFEEVNKEKQQAAREETIRNCSKEGEGTNAKVAKEA